MGDDYLFSGDERKNVPVDKMRLRPFGRLPVWTDAGTLLCDVNNPPMDDRGRSL